jgi:hypothetical protein
LLLKLAQIRLTLVYVPAELLLVQFQLLQLGLELLLGYPELILDAISCQLSARVGIFARSLHSLNLGFDLSLHLGYLIVYGHEVRRVRQGTSEYGHKNHYPVRFHLVRSEKR